MRSGRLVRIHRGVYSISPRLPPLGPVAAAILACRRPAWASHRTGAWVRDLRADGRRTVDVTAGAHTGRLHRHVVVHFGARIRPQDVDVVERIPVTSVARTLLDCAPVVGRQGTERMVREAEHLGSFDLRAVRDLMSHVPGHPGWTTLRLALGEAAAEIGQTTSDHEDAMLAALRELGARGFECNACIALGEGAFAFPDFYFRHARLVVEVDPRSTHDRTANYRSDRVRDRALKRVADIDTMRFSDEDLRDPHACAAEVLDRLARTAVLVP